MEGRRACQNLSATGVGELIDEARLIQGVFSVPFNAIPCVAVEKSTWQEAIQAQLWTMLDSRDKSADVLQVKVSRRAILDELKTVIKAGSRQALEMTCDSIKF